MSRKKKKKPVIGRHEWFSIPELGVDWVRGKIDTGARTSSLHATDITPFDRHGRKWLEFRTVDDLVCKAPMIFRKRVKSSNGMPSTRYFIEVTAETLDGEEHHLLVSLTCRKEMRCPLLLGRRALRSFLVDCSLSHVLGRI